MEERASKERVAADVQRLIEAGGDPLYCSFGPEVSIAFAKAILAAGPNVKTFARDGLNEKGERTRYRGVRNTDIKGSEIEWFDFSEFCPPRPPEDCIQ